MKNELTNNFGFLSIPVIIGLSIVVTSLAATAFLSFFMDQKESLKPTSTQISQTNKSTYTNNKSILGSKAINPSPLEILITRNGIYPSTLIIKKGQQVKWVNSDEKSHQIITGSNLPALSETDPLRSGESYNYTFDSPGSYEFYDKTSPNLLKGKVIVE